MRTEEMEGGYLAAPDGFGPYPGVVVIHEAYGLNDNIREICRRLAAQNYVAQGVDLFYGRNRGVCMARMLGNWLLGKLDDPGVLQLKSALGQLAARADVNDQRLGAIGFCMGGMYAVAWACTDPRLKVIAPYYGSAPRREEALRRLCPVVGSWPEKDFTRGAAATLEKALSARSVPHDLKVYPGARHSFFNDQSRSYHPAAAADSWQRVLRFFGEHL